MISGILRAFFKTPEDEDRLRLWEQGTYMPVVLVLTFFIALVALCRISAIFLRYMTRRRLGAHSEATLVAFFHPYWLVFAFKPIAVHFLHLEALFCLIVFVYSVIRQEEGKGYYGGQ